MPLADILGNSIKVNVGVNINDPDGATLVNCCVLGKAAPPTVIPDNNDQDQT